MNEININIEGYNVNGICVGCLNYNRKMFYCNEVRECFKLLGNIDVPDGLTVQVCWECLASVRAVTKFQTLMLKSYDILIDYSRKHTFLNSPQDLSKHASQRLTVKIAMVEEIFSKDWVQCNDTPVEKEEDFAVKVDTDMKVEFEDPISPEISEDITQHDSDIEDTKDMIEPFHLKEESSEEDMKLSKLKKQKNGVDETKKKKLKKNKRKNTKITSEEEITDDRVSKRRKNMPTHLVEVFTMTEDEMKTIRKTDLESVEFISMKYKCGDCILDFKTSKMLMDHMKVKHFVKPSPAIQCDVCKVYLLTKDTSNHRKLHLLAYRCKLCDYVTGMKRAMMLHTEIHEDLTCSQCLKQFTSKARLNYHKTTCFQEKPQCDCCGKVFANKLTLKYHLKAHPERKPDKPKENLNIKCKGCDKVFPTKKSYRAHVVIHEGVEYPCPVCGKLFQWKRNLARHLRNHAEREAGARHECRQCGKRFASRDCYNNHMRFSKRHVSEDAFDHVCVYCNKKFATKWSMVDHIDWDHLKKIKYQCSVCHKAFKTAKIMVAHMNNIHEGKKNREPEGEHLCDICGKSYKTVKRLKGHVWAMHTHRSTVKSFKCKLCPATFTWQTSIYKHMKMMHDNPKRSSKTPRATQPQKMASYGGLELANRIQYFQQNIASNVQNITHQDISPNGMVQNIV